MIPVANIYAMLSYAWNHVQETRTIDLTGVDFETPQDLLALVLARGTLRLLKRGVDREYVEVEEAIAGVRGRIDVGRTAREALRPKGLVACRFDELSENTLANRIIAATFRALRAVTPLAPEVRRELDVVTGRFPRVAPLRLSAAAFGGVVIHRNNRFYRFLIDICRLIHENLVPDANDPGVLRFRDFRRDEAAMQRLFEDFVREFLRREQSLLRVSAPKIAWDKSGTADASAAYLPEMRTDVVLENAKRVLIIDTKFYGDPLSRYYDAARLRSGHLYQISSYVTNQAAAEATRQVEGMLLYATGGTPFSIRLVIGGRVIRAETVDLSEPWARVRERLLEVAV